MRNHIQRLYGEFHEFSSMQSHYSAQLHEKKRETLSGNSLDLFALSDFLVCSLLLQSNYSLFIYNGSTLTIRTYSQNAILLLTLLRESSRLFLQAFPNVSLFHQPDGS